jgi:hypothetical protein
MNLKALLYHTTFNTFFLGQQIFIEGGSANTSLEHASNQWVGERQSYGSIDEQENA